MLIGDAALGQRLESYLAVFNGSFAPYIEGAEALSIAGGVAVFAGVDSLLTQAFAVGLGTPAGERELDAIEDFYRQRGAASKIHVTPWSDAKLLAAMGARGYALDEFENIFVRPLTEADAEPRTSDVRVEVITPEQHATWIAIGAEGFATEELSAELLAEVITPFVRVPTLRCYLAFVDGEPAATGSASFQPGSDIVGLFGAATLPRFRNRGAQAALVERRLADGVAAGCTQALVTTAPGSTSHRNVARRGFELAYTRTALKRAL